MRTKAIEFVWSGLHPFTNGHMRNTGVQRIAV